MPQNQYLASYMYIITAYTSLYYILNHKISNLTAFTCVMASTDQGPELQCLLKVKEDFS